ncbi:MAG: hypothetical protein SFZ24_03065 [Planctomycetota bacterium]|nr:hypothetical protein [Planctomycetota bacterium]
MDESFVVQMDVEGYELVAACWGRSRDATRDAVDIFTRRHMDVFLNAALDRLAGG